MGEDLLFNNFLAGHVAVTVGCAIGRELIRGAISTGAVPACLL